MARPREFDEETVLAAVVEAFWTNGYEATSTRELVRLTGLAQPSLHNAFGDKRSLFRRALKAYSRMTVHDQVTRLENSFLPGDAMVRYFDNVIDNTVNDSRRRGCLIVNTALCTSPSDADLMQAIGQDIEAIRDFFERCVSFGQQRGELPTVVPPSMAAGHLLCVLLGIRVLAKIKPDATLLNAAVGAGLAAIGLSGFRPHGAHSASGHG